MVRGVKVPIIQSLVQTPYKPIVREVKTASNVVPTQRWFTKFRETNTQYIQFPNITLQTNTEWKITIMAAVPEQGAYLLADSTEADSQSRLGMLQDGRTFGLSNDSDNIGGNTDGLLGGSKLRKYEAINDGGIIEILIDATRVNIFNEGTIAPVLNSIGRQYNGETGVPPMLGVISLVQIEKLVR